jgi:hypothetical protein
MAGDSLQGQLICTAWSGRLDPFVLLDDDQFTQWQGKDDADKNRHYSGGDA